MAADGIPELGIRHRVTGSKVMGAALSVKAGKVQLKLADGRELAVPMDKLSSKDQEFLTEMGKPPVGR